MPRRESNLLSARQAHRIRQQAAERRARIEAQPRHDLSAWDCDEPYDGPTYGGRSCPICGPLRRP